MNRLLLATLLTLGACTTPEPDVHLSWTGGDLLPADTQAGPPAPPDFSLAVGNLIAGTTNVVRITGAPPNATIRLARSTAGLGAGPCPPQLGDRCLPIRGPATLLPITLQANAQGDVTATILLPSSLSGVHVALAALVLGANPHVSNGIGRIVHPPGTSLPSLGDRDNDGATPADGDCNDLDPNVGPGVSDALGDGFDANCDNADGIDEDGDGFPAGPDCDDADDVVWPGGEELCDGVDNDCDNQADEGLNCTLVASFTVGGPPADLLFVIDNSCSMTEEQVQLANNFQGRVQGLIDDGVDFNLGVITTDVLDLNQSGRLQLLGGETFLTPDSPNAEAAFQAGVLQGTNGYFDEQGLRAVFLALTEPLRSGFNTGFLRPEADLHIVIVSDENDFSNGAPSVSNFVTYMTGLKASPAFTRLHLITGGPVGCPTADVDTNYRTAQQGIGGLWTSICGNSYDALLDPLADQLALRNGGDGTDTFVLPSPANPATIGVVVESPTLGTLLLSPADWTYDPVTRSLTITGVPLDAGSVVTVTWSP
jgi:hypothetical protein